MNTKPSRIREPLFYEFELPHKAAETTKNICCTKYNGTVDHSRVTNQLKKFCSWCNNLDDQARPGRSKTVDSESVFQAIEAKPVNRIQSVRRARPLGFIIFTTSVNLFEAAELCLMLSKYFDF